MELLDLVLGQGQTLIAIATARGDSSNKELIYRGRRLREVLDQVAEALARPTPRQRGLRFRSRVPATASLRDAMQ